MNILQRTAKDICEDAPEQYRRGWTSQWYYNSNSTVEKKCIIEMIAYDNSDFKTLLTDKEVDYIYEYLESFDRMSWTDRIKSFNNL